MKAGTVELVISHFYNKKVTKCQTVLITVSVKENERERDISYSII